MAQLKAIMVDRYRNFKERTRLEVAPIVVMIGKNGSGKSVLSRLLLIISDSIHNGSYNQPINLVVSGVRHASEFSDIPHLKSSRPFEVGASIEDDGQIYDFIASIRFVKERENLVLETYTLKKNETDILNIDLTDEFQLVSPEPKYHCRIDGGKQTRPVDGFMGFCPILKGEEFEHLRRVIEKFKDAIPRTSYLGPFRTELGYFIGSPRPNIEELGARGEHTAEILVDDSVRQGGVLAKKMSDWFAEALGHDLSLERTADYSRIVLQPHDKEVKISLHETGVGFSQILPIAAQNFLAQLKHAHKRTLIVEQPELHLHPAIHGEVSDLFLSTIHSCDSTVFIETHSEQMIMRLRRRVAEGMEPDSIRIWSVGHSAATDGDGSDVAIITLDRAGNLSDWPEGVFEESFIELGKMRSAARERQR